MKESGIPCYLTGGTALSRGYFTQRYENFPQIFLINTLLPNTLNFFIDRI